MSKKLVIFGTGGFGREAALYQRPDYFCVSDEYYEFDYIGDVPVLRESELNPDLHRIVVAVGNPKRRSDIVSRLDGFNFAEIAAHVTFGREVKRGHGAILCLGTILTTNIVIGNHCHLNLHTSIGHDCRIGDFFTTAPGARISGNCTIGDRVYIGTNAAVKEGITICDDVTIGMGAMVVKDIMEPGTYVGVPARKI